MPPSSVTEIMVDNIIISVNAVLPLLHELHDGLCPLFVQAISNITVSLIRRLQNMKRNKEECCQLMENIHGIIYAIVNAHLQSDPPGCLPPATLEDVELFIKYKHSSKHNSKIKHFFRQSQMSTLLKDCRAGLQLAFDNFTYKKLNCGQAISQATLSHNIDEMRRKTQHMHAELLEMISNLSDSTTSDHASSQYFITSVHTIRYEPQPNHKQGAILGPGGIGKTNLARAVLHHPDVTAKYEDQLFVSCESATTGIEIAGFIGAHLGLKAGKNITKSVVCSLSRKSSCLLILDNLETTWESLGSRGGTEDLLSSLTDIPHLALIVTMRGAEHPSKVCWTQPFLPPLSPLSAEAARQVFRDITKDHYNPKDIDQILVFTGLSSVQINDPTWMHPLLCHFQVHASVPKLVLWICYGLSDIELIQSNLVIPHIRTCKSVLLSTSLAYFDDKKWLKSLVPIREYLQHFHPVAQATVLPLQRYFQSLLGTYYKYQGPKQVTNVVRDITLNLGNLHQVLSRTMIPQNPDLPEVTRCAFLLIGFSRVIGRGSFGLINSIQEIILPGDDTLAVKFTIEALLASSNSTIIKDRERLAADAKIHCQTLNDPALEAQLYRALGIHYFWHTNNMSEGIQCFDKALVLARDAGDIEAGTTDLIDLALINGMMGKHNTTQALANQAYILAQLCGSCYNRATALQIKALCAKIFGNLQESLSLVQTARELLGLCGMSGGILDFQLRMTAAATHMEKSEYTEARSLFTQIVSEM
ncbi:hypothetical protein C8R45DRAFT_939766 [Mycena sanguinolenta]|nr:hypothetical protein C8R45DRAFT_939766 [Mycena sanguinolenta]